MTTKEHDLSKGSMCPSTSSSKSKKTGGWRSLKPVFLDDKCRGCGICVQYCPEGCIELHEVADKKTKVAKVNYDYCKGCLLCMVLCPFKAVEKSTEK